MKCLQQPAVQKDKYCSSCDNDDAFITAGATFACKQATKQLCSELQTLFTACSSHSGAALSTKSADFPMSRRPDSWRLRPLDRVIWNHITDSLKEDSFWDSSVATDLNVVGRCDLKRSWDIFCEKSGGKQGNASGFARTWAPRHLQD